MQTLRRYDVERALRAELSFDHSDRAARMIFLEDSLHFRAM